jgi:hypothetical protein
MKIAYLFLTIDDVNCPQLWNNYFENNTNKYNIYVHPKHPNNVSIEWMKCNIIKNLVETKWGHFCNAYIALLKEALQNDENEKFIFLSDGCIPIKNICDLYKKISKDDIKTSYVDFQNITDEQLSKLLKKSNLPNNYINIKIKKHSGWFMLSKYHAIKLLSYKELYKFNNIQAGDELILSPILNDIYIQNFKITYVDWEYTQKIIDNLNKKLIYYYEQQEQYNKNYKDKIFELKIQKSNYGKHPQTFNIISNKEFKKIVNNDCFFARKFTRISNIVEFDRLINLIKC